MTFGLGRARPLSFSRRLFSRLPPATPPNGRVFPTAAREIEIKNVKLALPVTGALHDITFSLLDVFAKHGSMSFKDVVEKPDEARARLREAKSVLVSIPNISDRKDLFLGKFERGAPMPGCLLRRDWRSVGCELSWRGRRPQSAASENNQRRSEAGRRWLGGISQRDDAADMDIFESKARRGAAGAFRQHPLQLSHGLARRRAA